MSIHTFREKYFAPGLKNPRQLPPRGIRIDQNHPLTGFIRTVFLGGQLFDPYDYSTHTFSGVNAYQNSWYFDNTGAGNHLRRSITGVNASGVTIALVGRTQFTADTEHHRGFVLSDENHANRRVSLGINNAQSAPIIRYNPHDGTTNATCDISATSSLTDAYLSIGAIERWSSRVVISEGDFAGEATDSTTLSTTNVGEYDIACVGGWYQTGSLVTAQRWEQSFIDLAVLFDVDIGEAWLRSFLKDPWQIFEPANELFFFPLQAGGFQAAWARNANQIIQVSAN